MSEAMHNSFGEVPSQEASLGTLLLVITTFGLLTYGVIQVLSPSKPKAGFHLGRYHGRLREPEVDDSDDENVYEMDWDADEDAYVPIEAPRGRMAAAGQAVRDLPWEDYRETAAEGAQRARRAAKRGYAKVRALPWEEYGQRVEHAGSHAYDWTAAKGKEAYEGGRRLPWDNYGKSVEHWGASAYDRSVAAGKAAKAYHDSLVYMPTPEAPPSRHRTILQGPSPEAMGWQPGSTVIVSSWRKPRPSGRGGAPTVL